MDHPRAFHPPIGPTGWEALSSSGTTAEAAELVLVSTGYDDALVVTDFGLAIPDSATVLGIAFQVDREADEGFAVDDSVRILKNGTAIGDSRSQSGPGLAKNARQHHVRGNMDLWGASWSPADLRADSFGVSISPKYTGPANAHDRAHIDSVQVEVYYSLPCD